MYKKNKGWLGLILGLFIALITYWLIKSPTKSTIDPSEMDFAVKDTAAIQKVIITGYIQGTPYSKVYLTKKSGEWWVNDQFKAQTVNVEHLLQTIYSIQMQQPLHPNAIENVKKLIQKRNLHVIIQNANGSTLKGYYIGPATPDSKGNYILLEGAEKPFIAEIPGFSGYFSTRFSPNPEAWRDYTLWKVPSEKFQSFEIKDKNKQTLTKIWKEKNTYFINHQPFSDTHTIKTIENHFLQCTATGLAKNSFPNAQDSLSKISADFWISINNKNYLLWKNPYGAFFIVPIKQSNQTIQFDGEVMLIQKLTVQKWLLDTSVLNKIFLK